MTAPESNQQPGDPNEPGSGVTVGQLVGFLFTAALICAVGVFHTLRYEDSLREVDRFTGALVLTVGSTVAFVALAGWVLASAARTSGTGPGAGE